MTTSTAMELDRERIAAIDIGTNSVRMSLVHLDTANGTWAMLSQYRETVRLGQGEFAQGQIDEAAIQRGVQVLQRFAQIARGRGVAEIVAIATAALREAHNRDEFIERAREQAGVDVRIVSGMEEARLIYLGVASGVDLGESKGLFIDIGGGSTELIVGTQREHLLLESLKLGAIRVANQFLSGVTGSVSPELYDAMRLHVRGVAAPFYRKIADSGFDRAIASSGTAMNLAAVAAARSGSEPNTLKNYSLKTTDLAEVATMLCSLTVEERRRVPGLNPERADIIPAGAAILQTIAEDLHLETLLISDRSLREGILVDSLLRRSEALAIAFPAEAGVRRRSILALLQRTGQGSSTNPHPQQVAALALRLFDSLTALGLHLYSVSERELLEYAALLHDIGIFISHTAHHRHSYYLIRHSPLVGFTDIEIEIMANLAYFHRKSPPKKRHEHFQTLPTETQRMVRSLSALLRLAEGLDHSHLGVIQNVEFSRATNPDRLVLTLFAQSDLQIELLYVESEKGVFEATFGLPLEIVVDRNGTTVEKPPIETVPNPSEKATETDLPAEEIP